MEPVHIACKRLQNHDASLTLLNLSCEGIGSEGVQELSNSCSSFYTASTSSSSPFYHLHDKVGEEKKEEECFATTTTAQTGWHSPLVALWLESNDIYPRGAVALTKVISASPSLKYLYMAHNSINNSGVTALSNVVMAQLQVCNFADNEIGPLGGRAIANNLRSSHSAVSTLILESNHLRDDGAIAIAESLKDNTTLKVLDLRYNHIGLKGIKAFRDLLVKDNMTLQVLLLGEENDHCMASNWNNHHQYGQGRVRGQPHRRYHRMDQPPLSPSSSSSSSRFFTDGQPSSSSTTGRGRQYPCRYASSSSSSSSSYCTGTTSRICETCRVHEEIDYYLSLNNAGRHSFFNLQIPSSLWPRILSTNIAKNNDPSMMYSFLSIRPDVVKRMEEGTYE